MIRLAILGLVAAGLAACAGPPIHYYTLDPVPPVVAPVTTNASTALPLVVTVTLPETLDRPELVRVAGPDRLDISGTERWAAPLDDLVRRALAQDLAERMPGRVVLADAPPGSGGSETLVVTLDHFAPDLSGIVTVDGHWTVLGSSSTVATVLGNAVVTSSADNSSSAAAVRAMSAALGQLADRIGAGGSN